eukprot:UN19571
MGLNVPLLASKKCSLTSIWMHKVEQCRRNCREQLNSEIFCLAINTFFHPQN